MRGAMKSAATLGVGVIVGALVANAWTSANREALNKYVEADLSYYLDGEKHHVMTVDDGLFECYFFAGKLATKAQSVEWRCEVAQ